MTNRITVYGHLGKDAEVKDVSGKRIMVLSVASNHKIKGQEVAVWRKVTFWEDNYRKMEDYLKKGASVRVYGEEQPPRIYEGRVQLEMIGKDIMFNSSGKKSDDGNKKDGEKVDDISNYFAEPAEEENRFPGMAPC